MKKLIITACILFVSGIIIAGASIAGGAFEPVDLKAQSVEFNASDITAMDIDSVLDRVEISGYSGEKVRVTYSEDLKRSCSVSVENEMCIRDRRTTGVPVVLPKARLGS